MGWGVAAAPVPTCQTSLCGCRHRCIGVSRSAHLARRTVLTSPDAIETTLVMETLLAIAPGRSRSLQSLQSLQVASVALSGPIQLCGVAGHDGPWPPSAR